MPEFMSEGSWWAALLPALLAVSIPAMKRSFRMQTLLFSALLWLAAIAASALMHGAIAAAATILVPAFWGTLATSGAIFFAGIGDLAKKRYRT